MYICIYVYLCVYMYICIFACIYVYMYICVYKYPNTNTYIHTHTLAHTHTHTHTHKSHTHTLTHLFTHAHTYTHILSLSLFLFLSLSHTHTHTYTHTYTQTCTLSISLLHTLPHTHTHTYTHTPTHTPFQVTESIRQHTHTCTHKHSFHFHTKMTIEKEISSIPFNKYITKPHTHPYTHIQNAQDWQFKLKILQSRNWNLFKSQSLTFTHKHIHFCLFFWWVLKHCTGFARLVWGRLRVHRAFLHKHINTYTPLFQFQSLWKLLNSHSRKEFFQLQSLLPVAKSSCSHELCMSPHTWVTNSKEFFQSQRLLPVAKSCCSVFQCVATCCNVLQRVAVSVAVSQNLLTVTKSHTEISSTHKVFTNSSSRKREVGGWGRVPFSRI